METNNIPYKVSILADGRYIIQSTDTKDQHMAFSERYGASWALLHGGVPGHSPTFYDPTKLGDMERLKANLKNLIQRDEQHRKWVERTTPISFISAEEFLK